ncbi:MAG: segregation/condensation protein A [Actinomycetota bacterium]|nr:segregation/condensation protein A [Actinomycetota bacterium]
MSDIEAVHSVQDAAGPDMTETEQRGKFVVELPLYEGPFRMLAELIVDQKVDVCDVPVAKVTEAFLARGIDAMDTWNLEETTWFVATCAALLELKVGRLLPRATPDTEDELLDGVSPDLLYARSLELSAFRRVAERLEELMAAASLMVPRTAAPPAEFAHLYPDVMDKVTPDGLQRVAAALLAPRRDLDLSHVTPIRVSLSDALSDVQDRLQRNGEVRFSELVQDRAERIEIVIRFLALLELYREGKVDLSQAERFGDIRIRWEHRHASDGNGGSRRIGE